MEPALTELEHHDLRPLLDLARGAIRARLEDRPAPTSTLAAGVDEPRGVFVTLRRSDGSLRGCIGSLEPQAGSLSEEVSRCAVLSALEDSRFAAVSAEELGELEIEVSVLGSLEAVADELGLDPSRYGVVVSSGLRRGVLLPGIEGVGTVEDQIGIARRKAGIFDHEPVELHRFVVVKIRE